MSYNRPAYYNFITQQYAGIVHHCASLLNCYSATLVCLTLSRVLVQDSCLPVLQAVFSCSALQRCSLYMQIPSQANGVHGRQLVQTPAATQNPVTGAAATAVSAYFGIGFAAQR